MRERNLLYLFLALNVGLAGAFIAYLFLSASNQPEIVSTTFPTATKTNSPTNAPLSLVSAPPIVPKTNVPVTVAGSENKPAPAALTNSAEVKPVPGGKKFTWEQVESDEYLKYLDNLRAAGCPEEKVRYIILADINELCAKRRMREAVAHDTQWWRAESDLMMVNVLQEKGRQLEEERGNLVTRLLGPEALDKEKGETLLWSSIQLTGPVLGSLSPEVHNQVQEICARAKQRSDGISFGRDLRGQPLSPVEIAELREQTRVDLKQVLNEEELEEFLLRFSYNAQELRKELRGIEPTPEEFRKVFRAVDPMDHQMQLEVGSKEALSEKQRDRYERQRDLAIKEALGPQRFEAFLLTKDPFYRQAQMFALQYGAPPKAIMPIYQMTKANESKRQQILNDPALSAQEKSAAIGAIYQEQQRSIQQIAAEANAHR